MDLILELAKRSLQWHEEDLYSFVWQHESSQEDTRASEKTVEMVFVRYDRDSGHAVVVTYHCSDTKKEIYQFIHGKLNPWIKEALIDAEESGD